MKVWAKLLDEENIKMVDATYENTKSLTFNNYEIMLREIAYLLDIPTPLTLKSQFNHLKQFNTQRYKTVDFVENIEFNCLELEIFG